MAYENITYEKKDQIGYITFNRPKVLNALNRQTVEELGSLAASGEFVFVAILGGTGNVLAPFLGAAIFEAVRTVANQYAPNVWQMTLGIVMLALILFLPSGLWSLVARLRRQPG